MTAIKFILVGIVFYNTRRMNINLLDCYILWEGFYFEEAAESIFPLGELVIIDVEGRMRFFGKERFQ